MKLSQFVLEQQNFALIEDLFEFCIITAKWEAALGFRLSGHIRFLKLPKIATNLHSIQIDFQERFLYICETLIGCEVGCIHPSSAVLEFMSLVQNLELKLYVPLVVYIHANNESFDCAGKLPTKATLLRFFYQFPDHKEKRLTTQVENDADNNRRILRIYEALLSV